MEAGFAFAAAGALYLGKIRCWHAAVCIYMIRKEEDRFYLRRSSP